MSFWDVVLFIIITFAFVAYLMIMFTIIVDLFRDRDTSGLAKALWMIALVFLPFLTAFIYLVTRGGDMSARAARDTNALKQQQDAYIREVAGSETTPAQQIAQAHDMLESGVISQREYDQLKSKALA